MKYQSYFRWILSVTACGCLFLLAVVSFQSSSLADAKSTLATPTPRPTMIATAILPTQIAKPTPTIIVISQPSSFSDPSSIIAIIGIVVQAVTLGFIIKYVSDTASMATATRDSADATLVSARAAENSLQEMKDAREEENAPFVIAYFNYIHSRHQSLYIVVENIGKNVARDIKLEFTPSLQVSHFNKDQIENNLLLKNGLKSLAPNYKIPIPFDYLMHYFQANLPMEYMVKVTYWWKTPLQPVVFEYPLDLALFKFTDFVTETGLGEIDVTLKNLADQFSHYSYYAESANNLLNHIANAINRGLAIRNHVSVSHDSADILIVLKEFVLLWVVDYGKQREKWNKPFIFGLRARATHVSEALLKGAVALDSKKWTEQLNSVISNISKLGSMELDLDDPTGVMSTLPFLVGGGSSKEDFDNLGDSIVADTRTVIELIDKEQASPLTSHNTEEAQPSTSIEEANLLNGLS